MKIKSRPRTQLRFQSGKSGVWNKLLGFLFILFITNPITLKGGAPELRHVFDIHAEIGAPIDAGNVAHGKRIIIPITGGNVTGLINGRIIPGGADYQLVDTLRKKAELKAIYSIITPDSTLINVTNEGLNIDNDKGYYFTTSPKFECDVNSPYAWLNDRIFVCRPQSFLQDGIVLRVWVIE